MARIFITGSSDGLGSLAAKALVQRGHSVTLHARNAARAEDAKRACPGAENVLIADLTKLDEVKKLAQEANALGPWDTVIHNAGLYRGGPARNSDGIPAIAAVNSLAPYMLCALMDRPKRVLVVSSGLHKSGNAERIRDADWKERGDEKWSDMEAYSDSKLHNVLLANAVARLWRDVEGNSMDPGWQPTKMGGASAPGNMEDAVGTYVLIAEGKNNDTGKYYYHSKVAQAQEAASDVKVQDAYLNKMEELSGIKFPGR